MFKTETHVHMAECSRCARIGAEEMIKLYRDAGYKTVFISDHFQLQYFRQFDANVLWTEQTSQFLIGYEKAKEAGVKYGVNVILSAELRFNNSPNHYLLYGIDKSFLDSRPDILNMTIEEFYPYAKSRGVTVVQAHPFRDGKCTPMPNYIDAVEVYNSNPRHENFDAKTLEMAKKFNLPITAGSDSHRIEDVALSGVISEKEIKTAEDYVELMLSGKLQIIKQGEK